MVRKTFFCLLLTLLIVGCSREKEDNEIYEYNLPENVIGYDEQLVNTSKDEFINSELEYKEFTHSETASGINFSKKSLVVIYGCAKSGITKLNKSILKTDDRYSITILVQTNIHQTIDSWYVAYVVPKTVANKVHYCLAYD
jgi:hypothetical protein